MNTGNNTAGKTAPERYVSEKAFEELPDAFQKLAELLDLCGKYLHGSGN